MARAERAIPRKLKPQVMPFAVESAGAFDLGALYAAVRDGANAVGLLAAGDLPAALSVILAVSGHRRRSGRRTGSRSRRSRANPEAIACCASRSPTTTTTSRARWSRSAPA